MDDVIEPDDSEQKLTVYFNPFAFTAEENNEFLRRGYEVMPIQVPPTDRDLRAN